MTTGTALYSRTWIDGRWLDTAAGRLSGPFIRKPTPEIQAGASELGTTVFLTRGEAIAAEERSLLQIERVWQL